MAKSKTSAAVKNRYNAKAYERISFVVRRGEKEKIKSAADSAGQSVNAYITAAVYAAMGCDPPSGPAEIADDTGDQDED